jgi:predicted  nucleic acid-binding Zn-ribbon protein
MKTHVILAAAVIAACTLPAIAQSGSGSPDTLSALLVEVRALRVAMERAASTTPQIQLLAARLTVQNERLARATGEATAVHQELEGLVAGNAMTTNRIAQLEEAIARDTNQETAKQLKAEQAALKMQIDLAAAHETQLRARDTELANLAAAEQGQWVELNRRLDDLERELAAGRPR